MEPDTLLSSINQSKLTVHELKDELRSRGAKLTGNKSELEDRLRFILVTGRVIPGQIGKSSPSLQPPLQPPLMGPKVIVIPKTMPKEIPKVEPKILPLPNVPKVAPKVIAKTVPKVTPSDLPKISPFQTISAERPNLSEAPPLSPIMTALSDLKYNALKRNLKVDELKTELKALGIPTTGDKATLSQTLSNYLFSIDLTHSGKIGPVRFSLQSGDPGPIFDLYHNQTTETILQNAEKGDYVSFYDLKRNSYHTFQVSNVTRTPFGLVEGISLTPKGYSLIRYGNQWKLFYQPQAGDKQTSKIRDYDVSIAYGLELA